MKFRYHAGSLAESLETQFEFSSKQELVNKINERFAWCGGISGELKCEYYGYDRRIDEETHLITDDRGVIGMTDCNINKGEENDRHKQMFW